MESLSHDDDLLLGHSNEPEECCQGGEAPGLWRFEPVFDGSSVWDEPAQRGAEPPMTAGTGSTTGDIRDGVPYEVLRAVETKRFSLTNLHSFLEPGSNGNIFAVGDAPLVDAAQLGVDVVRRPGGRNSQWFDLTEEDPILAAKGYRNIGARVPATEAEIAALVNTAANETQLTEFLRACADNGLKAVLRIVHQGTAGANESTLGTPSAPTIAVSDTSWWDPSGLSLSMALGWDEANGWDGVTLSPEANRFATTQAYFNTSEGDWQFESFDISSPYKREMAAAMSRQIGELLLAVATNLLADGLRLDDVVDAFEFLNEVDNTPFYVDGFGAYNVAKSGEYTGRMFFRLAWGLRAKLRDDPGLVGDIPFMLPAITSYFEDSAGAPKTWQSKLDFIEAFASGVVKELLFFQSQKTKPAVALPDLLELVQEIDYHWYHRDNPPSRDRHIAYLIHEVDEVQEAVRRAYRDQVLQIEPAATYADDFADLPVRVHESGVSTGASDPIPADYAADGQLWQAHQLIRRIGGQLASAARQTGWFSWMSEQDETGEFEGTGLREEPPGDAVYYPNYTGTGSSWDASGNPQNLSWHAYQRLADQLGDRVTSGRMVFPLTASRASVEADLAATPSVCRGAVVFEYSLEQDPHLMGQDAYAYLLLMDPNVDVTTAILDASPQFGTASITQVALLPDSRTPIEAPVDELPYEQVTWPADLLRSLPAPVTLARTQDPILLFSPVRISWTCPVSAGTFAATPIGPFIEEPPDLVEHRGIDHLIPRALGHDDPWH